MPATRRAPETSRQHRLVRLLGLGFRGGLVLAGVDGTDALLRRGDCQAVVVASDASPRAREKAVGTALRRGVPVVTGPDAGTLGASLGKPPVMIAGIRDRQLAQGILRVARSSQDRRHDGGVIGQE